MLPQCSAAQSCAGLHVLFLQHMLALANRQCCSEPCGAPVVQPRSGLLQPGPVLLCRRPEGFAECRVLWVVGAARVGGLAGGSTRACVVK